MSHQTSKALLHYLVKFPCQKISDTQKHNSD